MTSARFIAVLTAMLCPALFASADDLAVNGSPYLPIVTRNIFGLLPIPTNAPVDPASLTPPPKITPNGIMTIFGKKEALYKVTVPGKPGKPAQDQSYVLSEGESQDDIEVTKIDDQADVITFNNHGVIQELPLSAAPDLSTPTPVGSPGMPAPPGMGGPGGRFGRGGGPGFAGRRAAPSPNQEGANPSSPASSAAGGASPSETDGLSPEAQALLIENNYLSAKAKNDGTAALFPPTPLRQQADGEDGGEGRPASP